MTWHRRLLRNADMGNGGQLDLATTLVSFERRHEFIEHALCMSLSPV
jgi:hypothetical protein